MRTEAVTSSETPRASSPEVPSIDDGVFAALPDDVFATLQTTISTMLQMSTVRVVLLGTGPRDQRRGGTLDSRGRSELRFCREAVRLCAEATIVSDVRSDDRVGVLAAGRGGIRFFAAMPIVGPGGEFAGTLCLIDRSAHRLRPAQHAALETAARLVATVALHRPVGKPKPDGEPKLAAAAEQALADANDAVAIFESESDFGDMDSDRIVYANAAFARLCGYAPAEIVGARAVSIGGPTDATSRAEIAAALHRGEGILKARALTRRDGTRLLIESSVAPLTGSPGRYVSVQRELRQPRTIERLTPIRDGQHRIIGDRRSAHQSTHDELSGLPNRSLLMTRLAHVVGDVQQGRKREGQYALLFVDLDRFKRINDTLGHLFGDALLVDVARRLQTCLRDDDFLARFAGDEFAVLISSEREPVEAVAIRLAERMLSALNSQPIAVAGSDVRITASVGIVAIDMTASSAEQVLQDADITTYHAKSSGRDRYKVFHRELRERVHATANMESALRTAILRRQFTLAYQPIVGFDEAHPAIEGFEVLLRWNRPGFGRVAAAEFIAVAEESGLIVPIGEWVLESACRQLAVWQEQTRVGAFRPSISVNISAQQLATTDLYATVRRIVTETKIDAHGLALELTESSIIADIDEAIAVFKRIRALGVHIFLDDFGTGYSSLSYLRRLGIDRLKIDRSFVSGTGSQGVSDPEIVGAVVALSHRLGIKATAEGVETDQQYRDLRALSCNSGQGYLFSEPVDTARATALMPGEEPRKVPLALVDHRIISESA